MSSPPTVLTPSPGPPRLVKTPAAVHPLPQGGEGCKSKSLHNFTNRNRNASARYAEVRGLHERQGLQRLVVIHGGDSSLEELDDFHQQLVIGLRFSLRVQNSLVAVNGNRKGIQSAAEAAHHSQAAVLP